MIKLKFFILYIFLLMCSILSASSQSDSLKIVGDSIQSADLGDWYFYSTLKVIKYKNSTQPTRLFAELYDNENKIVMSTDSTIRMDTANGFDTLLIDRFFDFEHIGFEYPFANSLEQKLMLTAGTFKLKFILYDSNFNVLDSAKKIITINNLWPAQLVGFWDNKEIYSGCLDTMTVKWVHPDTVLTPYYYRFKIHEVPIGFESDYEFLISDSIPVYSKDLYNVRQHNIDTTMFKYIAEKNYVISVLTSKNALFSDNLIINKGLSTPFLVKASNNTLKKRGSDDICTLLNNGFEDGTLNGWATVRGINSQGPDRTDPLKLNSFIPSTTAPEVSVVSKPSIDGNVPLEVVPFGGGNKACKLGNDIFDSGNNPNIFGITKTFTVPVGISVIPYSFAVVLEDGSHSRSDQPYFHAQASGKRKLFSFTITSLIQKNLIVAKTGDPVFTSTTGNWNYRLWDCDLINLSQFTNRTVTIAFIASDCKLRGHVGRAYVDFCVNSTPLMDFTMNSTYCQNSNITVNGGVSEGAVSWNWSVVKCNSTGSNNIGNPVISDKFFGTSSKTFNISSFLTQQGFVLDCNSYYKVSLTGATNCGTMSVKSKIFFVECPAVDLAGPDKCCVNGNCNIQLGSTTKSGYTYSWSPNSCLSSSSISNPYFNSPCAPNTPTNWPHKLILTVTSAAGCTGTDEVYVFKNAPSALSISLVYLSTCKDKLTVSGLNLGGSITWTDQNNIVVGTGAEIIIDKSKNNRTITVTVTNPCGSASANINISGTNNLTGDFPVMIYPSAMRPSVDPIIDALPIWEFGKAHGVANCYNATEFRFRVYDRWGGKIHEEIRSDGAWSNGTVWWNAKADGSSDWVPNGQYVWTLDFKNCDHQSWYRNWLHRVWEPDYSQGKEFSLWCLCYKYKAYHWVNKTMDAEVVYMEN